MTPFTTPIYVTRPFLPPLAEFCEGLEDIWESRFLTNYGPQVRRFEKLLTEYFRSENICLFTNGTLALQIGLQGMNISGEVITTPFTFVATAHAMYWDKIRPVFCDIEPEYFTLDPDKVETLITPWTTAILAVHVFGYPCQLDQLQAIARRHHLKLLYDAAHAFGVSVNNQPMSGFGDLSMFSFHATKPFHSLEGGMLTFKDPGLKRTFHYLQNFGFKTEIEVVMPGTNAKMNELQALMGIQVLQHIDRLIEQRRQVDAVYRERLCDIPGLKIPSTLPQHIRYNYAYIPVEIYERDFGVSRDGLYEKLKTFNIFTRRYFYPLVCDFSCYRSLAVTDPLTVARGVADRILTLPIYHDLAIDDVHRICDVIIHIRERHT